MLLEPISCYFFDYTRRGFSCLLILAHLIYVYPAPLMAAQSSREVGVLIEPPRQEIPATPTNFIYETIKNLEGIDQDLDGEWEIASGVVAVPSGLEPAPRDLLDPLPVWQRAAATELWDAAQRQYRDAFTTWWPGEVPERLAASIVQKNGPGLDPAQTQTEIRLVGLNNVDEVVGQITLLLSPDGAGSGDYERGLAIGIAAAELSFSLTTRLGPFHLFNPATWVQIVYDKQSRPVGLELGYNGHQAIAEALDAMAARVVGFQAATPGANPSGFFHVLGNVFSVLGRVAVCTAAGLLASWLSFLPARAVVAFVQMMFSAVVEAPHPFLALAHFIGQVVAMIAMVGFMIIKLFIAFSLVSIVSAMEKGAARALRAAEANHMSRHAFGKLRQIYKLAGRRSAQAELRLVRVDNKLASLGQIIPAWLAFVSVITTAGLGFAYCWTELKWPKIAHAAAPVRYNLLKPDATQLTMVEAMTASYATPSRVIRLTREEMLPFVHRDPDTGRLDLMINATLRTGINFYEEHEAFYANTVEAQSDLAAQSGTTHVYFCGWDSYGVQVFNGPSSSMLALCINQHPIMQQLRTDLNPQPVPEWIISLPDLFSETPYTVGGFVSCDVTRYRERNEFFCEYRIKVHGEGATALRIEGPTI